CRLSTCIELWGLRRGIWPRKRRRRRRRRRQEKRKRSSRSTTINANPLAFEGIVLWSDSRETAAWRSFFFGGPTSKTSIDVAFRVWPFATYGCPAGAPVAFWAKRPSSRHVTAQ